MTDPQFYTADKVAEIFSVIPNTVRCWVREGRMNALRINGRIRISKEEVLRFANAHYGPLQGKTDDVTE